MTTLVRETGASRAIVGYGWPWTIRPGERIDFMVSCENEAAFRADLVRIICADDLTSREMYKEEEISAPFNGNHPGRRQDTHLGSYVEVTPRAILDDLNDFAVQVMVCPTLLAGGPRVRMGAVPNSRETPAIGDQFLVSRWDEQRRRGWALLLDRSGRPVFMIGGDDGVHSVVVDTTLVQDKWFLVVGGVDGRSGEIHVAAEMVGFTPGDAIAWPPRRQAQSFPGRERVPQAGPLRFGACTDGPGRRARLKPAHCFNGRLDRVRLVKGTLANEEAKMLAGTVLPDAWRSRVIGFWDFSQNMSTTDVVDLSAHALSGTTVNAPTRAVRGVGWDGSAHDWPARPDHFSAIHFHDDDLYDAEWDADFSYFVPRDLPSGIYAARLRQGTSEDYIPFFVAPPLGQARASVALLIPTLSYTAYTNVTGMTTLKRRRQLTDSSGQARVVEEDWHPCLLQDAAHAQFLLGNLRELGKGIYANHTDGTLFTCASQRHPNMTVKPKGMAWQFVPDTYLTDWLERKRIQYDVITDDLLHAEGVELLNRYSVVLTGTHPEYYTRRMLDAVDRYQRQGGRWMYLGGNGFYWVTSVHAQLPGLIEVRKDSESYHGYCAKYELRHAFEDIHGGLWKDNGRPPQLLAGVGLDVYGGFCWGRGAPYRRLPGSYDERAEFIFRGVSSELIGGHGLFGNGAAGQEVDAISVERGTPAHALHLARADDFPEKPTPNPDYYISGPIADMVFFETPNGGAVFSVGSISWAGSLSTNAYENDISRITENVLRRFMDKAPFS